LSSIAYYPRIELPLFLPHYPPQGSAKLEKAEILQMTVDHLRHLHQTRDPRGKLATSPVVGNHSLLSSGTSIYYPCYLGDPYDLGKGTLECEPLQVVCKIDHLCSRMKVV